MREINELNKIYRANKFLKIFREMLSVDCWYLRYLLWIWCVLFLVFVVLGIFLMLGLLGIGAKNFLFIDGIVLFSGAFLFPYTADKVVRQRCCEFCESRFKFDDTRYNFLRFLLFKKAVSKHKEINRSYLLKALDQLKAERVINTNQSILLNQWIGCSTTVFVTILSVVVYRTNPYLIFVIGLLFVCCLIFILDMCNNKNRNIAELECFILRLLNE